MTHLFIVFVWLVMAVSTFQLLFLAWIFWPRLRPHVYGWHHQCERKVHCIWCWQDLHIRRWFPSQWTSRMCDVHFRRELSHLAARRATRLATVSTFATLPQAEGVELAPVVQEQMEVQL